MSKRKLKKPPREVDGIPVIAHEDNPIKKLRDVRQDDGQYRIRLQRFRIRYDIYGTEVLLQYCGLRREDTYN